MGHPAGLGLLESREMGRGALAALCWTGEDAPT